MRNGCSTDRHNKTSAMRYSIQAWPGHRGGHAADLPLEESKVDSVKFSSSSHKHELVSCRR